MIGAWLRGRGARPGPAEIRRSSFVDALDRMPDEAFEDARSREWAVRRSWCLAVPRRSAPLMREDIDLVHVPTSSGNGTYVSVWALASTTPDHCSAEPEHPGPHTWEDPVEYQTRVFEGLFYRVLNEWREHRS